MLGGVPVDHEVDPMVEVAGEPVQEAAHRLGDEALGEDYEVHPALGTDRRHRVQREPVPASPHHRSLPLLVPGAAGDLAHADTDVVREQDLATVLPRLCPDRRPGLLVPAHGLRGLLDAPLVRPLERQPPPPEVLAHHLVHTDRLATSPTSRRPPSAKPRTPPPRPHGPARPRPPPATAGLPAPTATDAARPPPDRSHATNDPGLKPFRINKLEP